MARQSPYGFILPRFLSNNNNKKESRSLNLLLQVNKLSDRDLIPFFEDKTKLKIPSDITAPLILQYLLPLIG